MQPDRVKAMTGEATCLPDEQLVDRLIHYVGLIAGLVGSVAIVAVAAEHGRPLTTATVAVYGVALVCMIGASGLYNLAEPSPRKEWFRRLDHAAIFLMIAGTYTPVTVVGIGGRWGLGIAIFVWIVAAVGVALKLRYPRRFERLSIALYLALGWTILVGVRPLFQAVPISVIVMLGVGGLLYSVGTVFHLRPSLRYHNAIWHGFVLGAASCHWLAILNGIVLAG